MLFLRNTRQTSLNSYRPWLIPVAAFASVASALCFLRGGRIGSDSIDLAGHYTLVDYFSTLWGTFQDLAAVHPTMAVYPPLAHIFGALIGHIAGSSFLGMYLASLIFISAAYVFLFAGAQVTSRTATSAIFLASLGAFLLLLRRQLLFGQETQGNFFFAQSAGHACMLMVVFFAASRQRSTKEIVLFPCLVFAVGWLFPLAQIQIAVGACILWAIAWRREARSGTGDAKRTLIQICIMGILCALAIRLHPTYVTMRDISNNPGEILARIPVLALALSATTLFFVSAYLAYRAIKGTSSLVYPSFLPAVGLAVSIAFGAHYIVVNLTGAGSEYALRKHTYAVLTVLIVALVCAADTVINPPRRRFKGDNSFAFVSVFTVAIAASLLVTSSSDIAISRFVQSQRELKAYALLHPDLMGDTVAQLVVLTGTQNFMLTAIDLRMRDADALRFLSAPEVLSGSDVTFRVIDAAAHSSAGCERATFGSIAVIRVVCTAKTPAAAAGANP